MHRSTRCDEIIRLIDEALGECQADSVLPVDGMAGRSGTRRRGTASAAPALPAA